MAGKCLAAVLCSMQIRQSKENRLAYSMQMLDSLKLDTWGAFSQNNVLALHDMGLHVPQTLLCHQMEGTTRQGQYHWVPYAPQHSFSAWNTRSCCIEHAQECRLNLSVEWESLIDFFVAKTTSKHHSKQIRLHFSRAGCVHSPIQAMQLQQTSFCNWWHSLRDWRMHNCFCSCSNAHTCDKNKNVPSCSLTRSDKSSRPARDMSASTCTT